MPEAGQALHLGNERPGEQALRRQRAVPVDVVVDELVVGGGAVAPVQDLLAGQVLEDELLVVDVGGLQLRSGGGGGGGARRERRDRSHRHGRDVVGRLCGCGFGAVSLPSADLLPLVLAGPCSTAARILRNARLITTSRRGGSVLHLITPLSGGTPPAPGGRDNLTRRRPRI